MGREVGTAIWTPEGGNESFLLSLGAFLINRSQFIRELLYLEEPRFLHLSICLTNTYLVSALEVYVIID